MTTTPEQLQAWREEFERPKHNKTPMLAILLYEKQENGIYRINDVEYEWQGYLRRCQETEQIMKLAKFVAMVAHFQFNKGGCSEACIQDTADECGLFLNGSDEFSPNVESTIKDLLK